MPAKCPSNKYNFVCVLVPGYIQCAVQCTLGLLMDVIQLNVLIHSFVHSAFSFQHSAICNVLYQTLKYIAHRTPFVCNIISQFLYRLNLICLSHQTKNSGAFILNFPTACSEYCADALPYHSWWCNEDERIIIIVRGIYWMRRV